MKNETTEAITEDFDQSSLADHFDCVATRQPKVIEPSPTDHLYDANPQGCYLTWSERQQERIRIGMQEYAKTHDHNFF